MTKKKKMKRYYVTFRVIGEQSAYVEASSKQEAIYNAIYQVNYDPVDFTVIRPLPSTAMAEEIKSYGI